MPNSGIYSVTVPGVVKGWETFRGRFGALPLSDLLAPAIFYAEDGFPVTDVISRAWQGGSAKLSAGPHAAEVFLPNGRAPHAGEIFKNPALAADVATERRKGRRRILRR
jgi:gamma-glutamyltranspeptidase/glutathione hydrolase